MNAPKDQIWNLLQSSGIMSPPQIEKARIGFQTSVDKQVDLGGDESNREDQPNGHRPSGQIVHSTDKFKVAGENRTPSMAHRQEEHERLLEWLTENQMISRLHREIIGAGSIGPFVYGEYLLLDKLNFDAPSDGHQGVGYLARHIRTGHQVHLEFFPGQDESDKKKWQSVFAWAERRRGIRSPNVFATYQAVVLSDHRFVASEIPSGTPFPEKVSSKTRLPWDKACDVAGIIAEALSQLHQREVFHENLWPGNVYFQSDGSITVKLDLNANLKLTNQNTNELGETLDEDSPEKYLTDDALDDQADWYSLGCILYRLVSGKPPKWDNNDDNRKKRIAALAKMDVPKPVLKLIKHLTSTSNDKPIAAKSVLGYFEKLTQRKSFVASGEFRTKTHERLVGLIDSELPPSELPRIGPETVVLIDRRIAIVKVQTALSVGENGSPNSSSSNAGAKHLSNKPSPQKRKKNLINLSLAIGTSVLACTIGILLVAWSLGSSSRPSDDDLASNSRQNENRKNKSGSANSEVPASLEPRLPSGWLEQTIVDEDESLLWESPTTGFPIDWSGVPAAPDFVFALRPAKLLGIESGQLSLKSLGTDFELMLTEWLASAGVQLAEIEQLIVSFHSDGSPNYQPCFVVRLIEPKDASELGRAWDSQIEGLPNADGVFYSGGKYSFLASNSDSKIESFVMAEDTFLRDEISRGAAPMGGAMGRLAKLCDGDRHFNCFFMPRILSNEQSQNLFGGILDKVRRPLMLFFDDRINAVSLSLHFDEDTYWEMQFDRSLDIKADELTRTFDEKLGATRDELIEYVDGLANSEYWSSLKLRYASMLQFAYSYSRVAVEKGEAVANGWLPSRSAHNLIAAAEISMSAGPGSGTQVVKAKPPQDLQELLDRKRTLKITSSPDLVNLLRDLQTEIRDDFPEMPFEFEIRLMGADLGAEGITQNQRPSDISLPNNSLSEILTEICFKANPEKNATSPSDDLCKLIWVKQEDPDSPGREIVMITTRKAANANGYELPKAFRPE